MLIVILGWLYVIAMVAITAPSVALGIVIFVCGGLAPTMLCLYIAGARLRRARREPMTPSRKSLHRRIATPHRARRPRRCRDRTPDGLVCAV